MSNGNYYMEEPIGRSGVGKTTNPSIDVNKIDYASQYRPFEYRPHNLNVGQYFDSPSSMDEDMGDVEATIRQYGSVNNYRAENQSGWQMAGNAIANNLVIAGTTFLASSLGLVEGLFDGAVQGAEGLWDTEVGNWAVDTQNRAREAMPIYRSDDYQDKSIWEKMGTGVFWADLVENLGFTEGMLPVGVAAGVAAGAIAPEAPPVALALVGSLIGALGEGAMEAINARNEEVGGKRTMADQQLATLMGQATSQEEADAIYQNYLNTMVEAEEDANNAGNFVFGSNVALLTLTNSIEFGDVIAKGFKTGRRALRGLEKTAEGTMKAQNVGEAMAKTAGKSLVNATSEGMEEFSQAVISNTPQYYTNYNRFNESEFNLEKRELVGDAVSAIGQSLASTMQDPQTAEEFASGFLIGLIGAPTVRQAKVPVTMQNNIFGEMYGAYQQNKREQELANQINARLADDKTFNSYYNGLVRHLAIQDDMNTALDDNDQLSYENAKSAQLLSDIMMFDKAGHLDYLKELVGKATNMSDEEIQSMIKETSKDGEGPFMQNGNAESVNDVRQKLEKKQQDLQDKIDYYLKSKEEFTSKYDLDDNALANALFLKGQIYDHGKRFEELSRNAYDRLKPLLANNSITKENGELWTPTLEEFRRDISTEAQVEKINKVLEVAQKQGKTPVDELKQLATDITDLTGLEKGLVDLNMELLLTLSNPERSSQDKEAQEAELGKKQMQLETQASVDALKKATTLQEFREGLNQTSAPNDVLDALNAEGNEMAKNYKEVETYYHQAEGAIQGQDVSDEVKEDALFLLQQQYASAQSLEDIANPGSVHINDSTAFEDTSSSTEEAAQRFLEAQYSVQKALAQVNKDNAYKDRFDSSYLDGPKDLKPTGSDSKTGSDSNAKNPPINGSATINPTAAPVPVGDVDFATLAGENNNNNQGDEIKVENQGSRKYYRPSISQLDLANKGKGVYKTYKEAEKERGHDYSTIYDYLENNGTFSFLNEGGLTAGEDIYFMIDPNFEESMKDNPYHTAATVFMVNKDGQVLGSLQESGANKYIGLEALQTKVREEYAKHKSQNPESKERFNTQATSGLKTKASRIMVGVVPYGTEERSLKEVLDNTKGYKTGGQKPIFAIMKNGTLDTNGKIEATKIRNLQDSTGKEGRLYLLIPSGDGTYTPSAIRVKHFNPQEIDFGQDSAFRKTVLGSALVKALEKLATASDEDAVAEALNGDNLGKILHLQDVKHQLQVRDNQLVLHLSKDLKNPDGTYQKTIIKKDGKDTEYTKQEQINVVLGTFGYDNGITISGMSAEEVQGAPVTLRDPVDIFNDLVKAFQSFNLPFQVSAKSLNIPGYAERFLSSDVLTTNAINAGVLDNWFVTDYFDEKGQLQKAEPPIKVSGKTDQGTIVQTPIGGKDTAIPGIPITLQGQQTVYVDLTKNTITDAAGKVRTPGVSDQIIMDLAKAQNDYGERRNGAFMVDNKVLIGDRVLDRTTQTYLTGAEAQAVKDTITNNKKEEQEGQKRAQEVLDKVIADQEKVDKERTDLDNYYVLEEDGQYHPYTRVHSRLGENYKETESKKKTLSQIQAKLSSLADDVPQYNKYLKELAASLSKSWKVNINLDEFLDKPNLDSRIAIVAKVKNAAANASLKRGSAVDTVIRQFIGGTPMDKIAKPEELSDKAFAELLQSLAFIKEQANAAGERLIPNNIVLFHKFKDGTRIAGEVDILAITRTGKFKIYDVKTSKYSFYEPNGVVENRHFVNPWPNQRISTKAYYTQQVSAYKNLFESHYGEPVPFLSLIPYVLEVDSSTNQATSVTRENTILITYDPTVNVPLEGAVRKLQEDPPVKTGEVTTFKYLIDGVVKEGGLEKVASVEGIQVYIAREPQTAGIGSDPDRVTHYDYYVVTPNGASIKVLPTGDVERDAQWVEQVKQAIAANPAKIKELAALKTELSTETPKNVGDTAATILQNPGSTNGAASAVAAINNANKKKTSRVPRTKLRVVDTTRQKWNKEKELAWLDRVLPQLKAQDRVRVVKGLIKVADKGAVAWGRLDQGIVTLSDEAAEGTTYHEAFHVVFNLLTDHKERQALFAEARERFGNLDEESLEEAMAEDFREWVTKEDNRGIGRRILDFFKNLLAKITHWKEIRPSLDSYYRNINAGKYKRMTLNTNVVSRNRLVLSEKEEILRAETQRFLDNFSIKIKDVSDYDQNFEVFDSLNRIINVRNVQDITDGVGEAIAFMMQHNPIVTELMALKRIELDSIKLKGFRRALRKGSKITLGVEDLYKVESANPGLRKYLYKEVGKDIAAELRKLYSIEPIKPETTYLQKIWDLIKQFFATLTPELKTRFNVIYNNSAQIAHAVKLNDPSIIRRTKNKPGTKTTAERVDIAKALLENPYEDSIIRKLQTKGIALAGSASIAVEGQLLRPAENPLHDIDFNATQYKEEELDDIIKELFPNSTLKSTIINGPTKETRSYIVLDRPFTVGRGVNTKGIAVYLLYDNQGKVLGNFVQNGGDLVLEEGVQGKVLDFFIGEGNSSYPNKIIPLNGREYLFSDARNAMAAKIEWERLKDIWDYNRFMPNEEEEDYKKRREEHQRLTRDRVAKAQIIWGHPTIGKTTYLERNDDIIDWDAEVGKRKMEFITHQIDPTNSMDHSSQEFKGLRSQYMQDWRQHPEYIEFLRKEWKTLVKKAKQEGKKLFASPLPLLEIGAADFDLFLAVPTREFTERNVARGFSDYYNSRGWKQSLDALLVKIDPSKVMYTDKYLAEFMREITGVKWGTLTEEEEQLLTQAGWTKENFDSVSQEEREIAVQCAGI